MNVLTVTNHHSEGCGNPPNLKADGCYTSYFENEHSEQFVYQFDYKKKIGTLWFGDIGWEHPITLTRKNFLKEGIILGDDELTWLNLVNGVVSKQLQSR